MAAIQKHRPSLTNDQLRILGCALNCYIRELSRDQAANLGELLQTIKVSEYLQSFKPAVDTTSDAALLAKYLGGSVAANLAPSLATESNHAAEQSTRTTELTDDQRYELIGRKSSTQRTEEETKFYLEESMRRMIALSKQETINGDQL